MRNRIIPNKKRPWYHSPLVAVFLSVLIVWASVVVVKTYLTYREARAMRNQLQVELDELNQKKAEIAEKLSTLSTPRGMEEEVRNRYRVVKPGEELVIIVNDSTLAPEASHDDNQPRSWWQKLRYFIGI